MALTLNSVAAKVLSLIGDTMDGDSVMLVDQHMPNALKTVCKFVAENKPLGHEKLLLEQTLASGSITTTTGEEYARITLSDFTYPFVIQSRFHRAVLTRTGSGVLRGYPVRSMNSLALGVNHEVMYYFVEPLYAFINADTTSMAAKTGITITHYIYATITQFPEELEDLLVAELIRLIQNEGKKQAFEEQKP